MGIRDRLNESPRLVTALTVVIVILAIGLGYWFWPRTTQIKASNGLFYTVDDGGSYFVDGFDKVPPFDHNGKPAVRAHVFKSDKKNDPYVVWMERYTPRGQEILKKFYSDAKNKGIRPPYSAELEAEREIRKVGETKWIRVRENPKEIERIQNVEGADSPYEITPADL